TSRITTSYGLTAARYSARSPSPAISTAYDCSRSPFAIRPASLASSSTSSIRTLFIFHPLFTCTQIGLQADHTVLHPKGRPTPTHYPSTTCISARNFCKWLRDGKIYFWNRCEWFTRPL